SKAFILVNLRDPHRIELPENNIKELYPNVEFCQVNLKSGGRSLASFREELLRTIQQDPTWKKTIGKKSFAVKKALEKTFAGEGENSGKEFISLDEFRSIAVSHGVESDHVLPLRDQLHWLGVGLHYPNLRLSDTPLVLNPEWISDGVYKIINWTHQARKHDIRIEELEVVFSKEKIRFPKEKYRFFFRLMHEYQLGFQQNKNGSLVIPHLLPEDQPNSLPVMPLEEALMIRYCAITPLPPNTISRFIVQHHGQILRKAWKPQVWRYGVVLEDEQGTLALVRELNEREITISVLGPTQTQFLSELRNTLNDIFTSFKSEKPRLEYYVELKGDVGLLGEEKYQLWLEEGTIQRYYARGRSYYDDRLDKEIGLDGTIHNYNISSKVGFGVSSRRKNRVFDFQDCNVNLQGDLIELGDELNQVGANAEGIELLKLLQALQAIEESQDLKDVKKGLGKRFVRFFDQLRDENSGLNTALNRIKHGPKIVKDIVQQYNQIADWADLQKISPPPQRTV
ncbi:MAG: COR domain-containing protein, partial [Bacteroidota bacterium]